RADVGAHERQLVRRARPAGRQVRAQEVETEAERASHRSSAQAAGTAKGRVASSAASPAAATSAGAIVSRQRRRRQSEVLPLRFVMQGEQARPAWKARDRGPRGPYNAGEFGP